ncbi:turripeptide Lol9.1-like [Portunus trituberculatus]|uniref:turripeptide Lol9.1-like n=1 Tax=Portunus trituberculatus TaxID=210409 RepID=UPI001E1CCB7E|nr:turripeptide Lol9.1-like [Portunus trituberculatus]
MRPSVVLLVVAAAVVVVVVAEDAQQSTSHPCEGFVICDRIYDPLCGSDGKTYGNKCELESENCFFNPDLTVAYEGKCEEEATEAAEVVW